MLVAHIHAASGRDDNTVTGCIREGVVTWQTMEAVLIKLKSCDAKRVVDEELGFKVLRV